MKWYFSKLLMSKSSIMWIVFLLRVALPSATRWQTWQRTSSMLQRSSHTHEWPSRTRERRWVPCSWMEASACVALFACRSVWPRKLPAPIPLIVMLFRFKTNWIDETRVCFWLCFFSCNNSDWPRNRAAQNASPQAYRSLLPLFWR